LPLHQRTGGQNQEYAQLQIPGKLCSQRFFGRHYYLGDPDETEKFEKAGGHSDPKKSACHIVGNAAQWVMEILLDKGVVRCRVPST